MKLVSWNVNGIRAIMKKEFQQSITDMNPDILCLQETKAQREDAQIAISVMTNYKPFINDSKARKGYSGTAILTKSDPISVTYDMGVEEHDQEGRVVTAEFKEYYLVNVYTPNAGSGLKRLEYRGTWDEAFFNYLKKLEEKKPVIVCGDLNVAHQEIDIARPKSNYNKTAGYTQQEIDGIQKYLDHGFVDSFRSMYPEEVKYSYWSMRFGARDRNVGWRIDYFLLSEQLMSKVQSAEIYNEYYGSDHCPISITADLS